MPVTLEQIRAARKKQTERQTTEVPDTKTPSVTLEQIQATRQRQQTEQRSTQLIEQLRGRLPSPGPLPTATQFLPGAAGAIAVPGSEEKQRRIAFQELSNLGFTPEQLRLTLQAQKMLGGPRIGRGIGGLVGAAGATALAGRIIPGLIDDALIMAGLIAAGGAGVAGVAGEAAQTAIEEKRLIGKREALRAFAIEAGTEIAGRAVVRGAKLLASPLIKQTVPEAATLIDDFAKVGGAFSPSELDKRFSIRIAEAFSRGSFGAKEIFQEFEERQGKATVVFANNIIEALSEGVARQTPEQIGDIFAKGITKPGGRVFNLLDDLFDPLYSQLDDLTKSHIIKQTAEISVPSTILDEAGKPFERMVTKVIGERIKGTGVSTKSLKTFRAQIVAQNQRLVDIAKRTGKELPLISPAGKNILTDIDNLPEIIGHSDYRAFRSKVLKETRKLNRDVDISEGMVKQISSITRKELLDPKSVIGATPEAKRLHANISNLFAASQKGLETTFPESLAKRLIKNPSRIIKEVFPNNSPKSIRLLRKSLVEPISGKPSAEGKVLWNQLRQEWLANAVDEATKEGVANPRVYNNLLRKLGRDGFEEMFPERSVRTSVDKIQDLFTIAGKTPPTGASLFSRGAQTLGVVKIWQGAKAGDIIGITSGGILSIGPLAFAKLATHPLGIKLLTAGFKLKPGASGLVPNAVRMVRLLREINTRQNKERLRAEQRRIQAERIRKAPGLQLRGFGGRGF